MGMITTTKVTEDNPEGLMDEALLEREVKVFEDDNELTQAIEYRLDGELVHRSVHVQLKRNVVCESIAAEL